MTWSISISAPTKADAKLAVSRALGAQLLAGGGTNPHARDFNVAQTAIHGAIDTCAEGGVSVSANGYLNGNWEGGDIPVVTGVVINMQVYSTRPEPQPEMVL